MPDKTLAPHDEEGEEEEEEADEEDEVVMEDEPRPQPVTSYGERVSYHL